jgi:hypothetical protein
MKKTANFFSLIFIHVFLILFYSCSYSFKGKIIKRGKCDKINEKDFYTEGADSQKQYLINSSKTEIITFTLKLTETMNGGNSEKGGNIQIYTITHRLNPGQELELYCSNYYNRNDGTEREKNEYEIVGEVIENK